MVKSYKLRFKITLMLALVFLLAFAVQGTLVSNHLQNIYLQKLNQEQNSRLDTMVEAIDRKLSSTLDTIKLLAKTVPENGIADPEILQSWLDSHAELLNTFDNGLFIFNSAGHLVVETPFRPGRRGRNFSFRPYYQESVRTRQAQISDPYISSIDHGHDTLMMSVPLLDQSGQLVAILGGSIDLMQKNFLGRLVQQRFGENGYFFMAALNGKMIIHPQPEKFHDKVITPGISPLFDLVMNGFEGCTIGQDCLNRRSLFAAKRLHNKAWVLCGLLPMEELLAPLYQGRILLWGTIGATTTMVLLLVLLVFRWVFRPLFLFSDHLSTLADKKGKLRSFAYQGHDELSQLIDTFNHTLLAMDSAREELNHAQSMAHIGSWCNDLATDQLTWSDEVFRIFGDQPQAYPATYATFLSRVHPEDRTLLQQTVETSLAENIPYRLQHRIILPNGKLRHVLEHAEIHCDHNGKPLQMVGTVQDITEQVQLLNRLNELATTDELTATLTRRELISVLERELSRAQRYANSFSVLFFDLDHFKDINDTYGHQIGDQALRHVCDIVREQLRDSDILGRYGGEEFCILLPDSTDQSALALAERIRCAVAQSPVVIETENGAQPLHITISIGVTTATADDSSTTVIGRADRAVYQAKDKGRNCTVIILAEEK
jgi:diguanylate cyclase (GGDEF)-like protein/PAS domain S-box-containing protein